MSDTSARCEREGGKRRIAIFDLDGTLLDTDAALAGAFVALGVPAEDVTFGHTLVDECNRLGISVEAYLDAYDTSSARPFPGVDELLGRLDRWALCSNKVGRSARIELARLGWRPEVALFAEDFGGPKRLGPVLAALAADAEDVIFVGDTDHDRRCAREVGVTFALAAWNPRAAPLADDVALGHPAELLELLL